MVYNHTEAGTVAAEWRQSTGYFLSARLYHCALPASVPAGASQGLEGKAGRAAEDRQQEADSGSGCSTLPEHGGSGAVC